MSTVGTDRGAAVSLTVLAGVVIGICVGLSHLGTLPIVLVALSAPALLALGSVRPEVVLCLFVVAGAYTLHGWVDVDIGVVLGALVLALMIGRVLQEGLPRIPVRVALAIAVAVIVLLGVSYSQSPDYGAAKGIRFGTLGILAMSAPLVLLPTREHVYRFLWWLWAIGMVLSVYAVAASGAFGSAGRLVSFGGGPITLGRLSGVGLAAGVYLMVSSGRWRLPAGLSMPVLLMALLGSGSRGPAVAALAAGGIAVIGMMARRGVRRAGLVALTAALAGAVAIVWQSLPETVVLRFALLASSDPGASVLARANMLVSALRLGAANPIAGAGTGSFGVASGMAPLNYPHNMLAELLAENGAPAAAMMAVVLAVGIVASVRWALRDGSPAAWTVVFVVVFGTMNSMVSGDLNDNQVLFAFLSVSAVMSGSGMLLAARVNRLGTDALPLDAAAAQRNDGTV